MVTADGPKSLFRRRATRRAVLGGSLAAGSVAVAYAALGGELGPLGSKDDPARGDTDAIKSESVRVSHLLRRAGFGVTQAEHDRYQSMGLHATLDELVNFTKVEDTEAERLAAAVPVGQANRRNPTLWWLVRIANTKRPLQEKMTFFWHGLLTSQLSVVRDPEAMIAQNEFFREHAFDTFPSILRGVSADRAMMVSLNVAGSQREAPNENYARELMELYSLGVGNYTEQDVREAARAFTGWQVPQERLAAGVINLQEPVFRPARFDNGIKTFLGQSGNFRPDDIVDIITQQPASAQYITRRLFAFFIYPDPSDKDLQPFVDVYNKSDRSVGAVVEAMLRSDAFYSPRAYRSIVKSPTEYAISAIKALGLQETVGQLAGGGPYGGGRGGGANALRDMGQVLFEPPNVAGWPGGPSWLNSTTVFARLNYLNQVTGGAPAPRTNARNAPPPVPAATGVELGTPAAALAHYLPLIVDDNVPADARQVLLDYSGGPDVLLSPEQLRGLVYLILGSPQFHLS